MVAGAEARERGAAFAPGLFAVAVVVVVAGSSSSSSSSFPVLPYPGSGAADAAASSSSPSSSYTGLGHPLEREFFEEDCERGVAGGAGAAEGEKGAPSAAAR